MDISEALAGAKLPEKVVSICLRGDLQADFEQAERELEESRRAEVDSLAAGSQTRQVAERIEALRKEMADHSVDFRLRAVGRRRWTALLAEHTPRPDSDTDKAVGVNEETFYDALIRECTAEPTLTDEQWTLLLDNQLTSAQFDQLAMAAWRLNRRDVDVPFSPAASAILRNSAPV